MLKFELASPDNPEIPLFVAQGSQYGYHISEYKGVKKYCLEVLTLYTLKHTPYKEWFGSFDEAVKAAEDIDENAYATFFMPCADDLDWEENTVEFDGIEFLIQKTNNGDCELVIRAEDTRLYFSSEWLARQVVNMFAKIIDQNQL